MRLAFRELFRRPGRFLPVTIALTGLVVLLVILAGFLDGLRLGQTGPYRAHEGRLIVVAGDAEGQLLRSRLPGDRGAQIAQVEGVAQVGPLDQFSTTVGVQGSSDLADVAVFGYSVATDRIPAPPPAGQAIVDTALGDRLSGISDGATLTLGPTSAPVQIARTVSDLSAGSPTIWVNHDEWLKLVAEASPASAPADGSVQAFVVAPTQGTDLEQLAATIDSRVSGVEALTTQEAINALPAVQQQSNTFQGIILLTLGVTLMVVALFFALLALERARLFAVFKALGARTRDLAVSLGVQAVVISLIAIAVGLAVSFAIVALLPPELPIRLEQSRMFLVAGGTLLMSIIGSLTTLRRLSRIDPASAIG